MGLGRLARVIKTEIEDYIVHTVESHYKQNQLCEQLAPSGDDSPAIPEDRCLMIPIEGTGNFVVAAVLSKSQGAEPGDKLIYSRDPDSGDVMSKIWLHNDGSIEIEVKDATTISLSGELSVVCEDKASFEAKGKVDIKGSDVTVNGNVKLTGGTCEIAGTAVPSGMGSLCALPYCAFTGAPQSGKISTGN